LVISKVVENSADFSIFVFENFCVGGELVLAFSEHRAWTEVVEAKWQLLPFRTGKNQPHELMRGLVVSALRVEDRRIEPVPLVSCTDLMRCRAFGHLEGIEIQFACFAKLWAFLALTMNLLLNSQSFFRCGVINGISFLAAGYGRQEMIFKGMYHTVSTPWQCMTTKIWPVLVVLAGLTSLK
uniref:NR LBD domain-containing protein n=1 Tax=Syphacia muris TaxID=451379 RepID=A0A0N5AC65_9BILA